MKADMDIDVRKLSYLFWGAYKFTSYSPNTGVFFQISCILPVTTRKTECSFSVLYQHKTSVSTVTEDQLNGLKTPLKFVFFFKYKVNNVLEYKWLLEYVVKYLYLNRISVCLNKRTALLNFIILINFKHNFTVFIFVFEYNTMWFEYCFWCYSICKLY